MKFNVIHPVYLTDREINLLLADIDEVIRDYPVDSSIFRMYSNLAGKLSDARINNLREEN